LAERKSLAVIRPAGLVAKPDQFFVVAKRKYPPVARRLLHFTGIGGGRGFSKRQR